MSATFSGTLGHLAHLSSLITSSPSSSSPAADLESQHCTQRPLPFQMALHCHGNCLMYAFATPLGASSPALRWVKTLCGYIAPPPLHIHTHQAKREEGKLNFTHYFMHHSHCWQHGWRPMRILKCNDAPFLFFPAMDSVTSFQWERLEAPSCVTKVSLTVCKNQVWLFHLPLNCLTSPLPIHCHSRDVGN